MLSAMDLAAQIGRGSLFHFSTGGHVVAFVVAQPCQAKLLGAWAIKAIAMTFITVIVITVIVITVIVVIVVTLFFGA